VEVFKSVQFSNQTFSTLSLKTFDLPNEQ
jgi:hypothetical protein